MITLYYYSMDEGRHGREIPHLLMSELYGAPIGCPQWLYENGERMAIRNAAWSLLDSPEREAARKALIDWYIDHGIPSEEKASGAS